MAENRNIVWMESNLKAEIKSVSNSVNTYKRKIQKDLVNENWKGLADTARSLHEYQERLDFLENLKELIKL